MYKRFWIICWVIALGLLVLSGLGVSSLGMHAKGLRAERQQEFIAVAEQVRYDIKKKLDAFILAEQARPYTDYQYYYVPMASNQAAALVRSPLGESISNGLAYGYFQLDSQSHLSNPYVADADQATGAIQVYLANVTRNLLPSLSHGESLQTQRIEPSGPKEKDEYKIASRLSGVGRWRSRADSSVSLKSDAIQDDVGRPEKEKTKMPMRSAKGQRRSTYPIDLETSQQTAQIMNRSRDNVLLNESNTAIQQKQEMLTQEEAVSPKQLPIATSESKGSDVVQIRVEPFVSMTVADSNGDNGIFTGQVFLLRHVQIEDKHWLQGFRLNETELVRQVSDSAGQFLRRGMGFDISTSELDSAAYTAVLDFGFGELVLNLIEQQPGWIAARVDQIRNWFFAILGVVWIAVTLAMGALWRNLREQAQLSQKKDDFISAVSHELRTPLTSIRMYTEMLEKDWVKSDEKRRRYYTTMRQESERLSRLIENVLDFSRIQRGKKQYDFTVGDVNIWIGEVVGMMRPYAQRSGFTLQTRYAVLEPFAFDRDAVVQIVINLIDNALKYAREATDKQILIGTHARKGYVVIEVEDHGPGIGRSQQKKIFEAFYRCGDESTRQAAGTGLGLALVKRFAEAHGGFVEIASARPQGALFRVSLKTGL